ncbi:permease-like cell division protein FtsX [Phytohabitans sp. ZYX-F-186]|uniref:Permease-like cell division protein FtsX n=1 Tax=Phytohabitans maris TaxID=3071409 RepID=A0ABU0ZKC3_9ACTN|nr:permease-like cell division protein FtsX [Phytohabitans sp. ZYX-F-186]MDQ7907499.1 permease-like cell division protein FtsX [Phytohabitans sp. ZYX-F-186]
MPLEPPAGAPPPGAPAGWSAPWLRWVVYAAVVVAAFVGSAVAATTVTLLVVDDGPPDGYVVTVFLTAEITTEQKTAVESSLSRLYPADSVQVDSRERTLARLREVGGDLGLADETAAVAESFRVEIPDRSIDCAALAPVGKLAGVRLVIVVQPRAEGRPNALLLDCP